jgi:hypothetical protein
MKMGNLPLKFTEFKKYLKPGKYFIRLEIEDDSGQTKNILEFEKDFSWGVLAINFNKSVYGPDDDSAYIQIGVLDDLRQYDLRRRAGYLHYLSFRRYGFPWYTPTDPWFQIRSAESRT